MITSTYRYVAQQCSKILTQAYTNSFSLGIYCLPKKYQLPIYAIYSFLRLGDEIVDAFHDYPQEKLLEEFKRSTYEAIQYRISLNPILDHFQQVVHKYQIDHSLIETFFESMVMDLRQHTHTQTSFQKYILGSSEVVGLMCLKVFCNQNIAQYRQLKPYAVKLGGTLQKVNFLRDMGADYQQLGRIYFPHVSFQQFDDITKRTIEAEIKTDFQESLHGIKMLPKQVQLSIYLAYKYYKKIFETICKKSSRQMLTQRVRIPNYQKYLIMLSAKLQYKFNLL